MSVQQPSEAPNQYVNRGPRSAAPSPETPFVPPDFRNKLVEVLSNTVNGCLQELGYRPSISRDLADIQVVAAKLRSENHKIFEDNRQLGLIVKDLHAKHKSMEQFYKHQVQALEQQIATLHRECQAILTRERNLAAGIPEYTHLQEECLRLKNDCAQLKQHIIELQVYLPFPVALNPNLTQAPFQQNRYAMSGQSAQSRVPQPIQDPFRHQQLQHPAQGQGAPPPQNAFQSQRPGFHPSPSRPSIIIPRIFTQLQQGNQLNGGTPMQDIPQVNQNMSHYRTPVSAIPVTTSIQRSASGPSKGTPGSAEINTQRLCMPVSSPTIHGWVNGAPSTSPHLVATTMPHQLGHLAQSLSRRQVSAPLPGQKLPSRPHPPLNDQHIQHIQAPPHQSRLHAQPGHSTSPLSSATVSPIVPGLTPNGQTFNPMMINTSAGVPFINPPQGVPTFAIGPPGKFLPSLAAYTKAPSPSTPISTSGLRSRPTSKPTSPQSSPSILVDLTKVPTVPQTRSPASLTPSISDPNNFGSTIRSSSAERSHTPHLTPSRSRGSVGPSEGISEAMTPLDTIQSSSINVAESPTAGEKMTVEEPHPESTMAPSLLMKRPSVHMDTDDKVEDLARKRPRLDKADQSTPSNRQTGTTVLASVSDPSSLPASAPILASPTTAAAVSDLTNSQQESANPGVMDKDNEDNEDDDDDDDDDEDEDEDEDEDDEFGPDGTRSIRYCLDIFIEDDENGVSICSLCISRHHQGLIAEPTSFAPDATQEQKVQHFLDEHPTSWENLLHGTIAPAPG